MLIGLYIFAVPYQESSGTHFARLFGKAPQSIPATIIVSSDGSTVAPAPEELVGLQVHGRDNVTRHKFRARGLPKSSAALQEGELRLLGNLSEKILIRCASRSGNLLEECQEVYRVPKRVGETDEDVLC
jgi:hypothetical protein